MHMKLRHLTTVLGAVLIAGGALTACSSVKNITNKVSQTFSRQQTDSQVVAAIPVEGGEMRTEGLSALQTESLIRQVIYGTWTVMEVDGQKVTGEHPEIGFESSAANPFLVRYYARTDCNTLNGVLALNTGNALAPAGESASTMRLCPDARWETPIAQALNSVRSYRLEREGSDDYMLYFKNEEGKTTMTLLKNDLAFINGAWKVTDIGATEISRTSLPGPMQLVIDIPELRVHGNTGCNILNGTLVRNPDVANSLSFININTTRMGCPDAGTEQQLVNALSKVVTVTPGPDNDTALLCDAAGNTLIRLSRISAAELQADE